MSRTQRALAHVDLDAHARSEGFGSAAERHALTRLHAKLGQGERLSKTDIESLRPFYPRLPVEQLHRYANGVNAGATARDRQDALTQVWAMSVGVPEHRIAAVCEQARAQSGQLAVMEYTDPLTQKLDERDAHRDRGMGIDEQRRVEAAQRAAMTNPETVRKADIEREWSRHTGGEPTLYAADRRELYAQHHDRLAERMIRRQVRDSDPQRLPDRGDDRHDDIAMAYDQHALEPLSRDELSLAANPLLESVDNQLTHAASMESE